MSSTQLGLLMASNETTTDYYDYYSFPNDTEIYVGQLTYICRIFPASILWQLLKIFILVTGLPSNLALLVLLVRGKIPTSSSNTLGINLSFLNVLYCVLLLLDISAGFHKFSDIILSANEGLLILNLIGCPLLATGMCVERYIAVCWPILYLELRTSLYRLLFSILVWTLTLVLAILSYFKGIQVLSWPLTVGISVLFGLMLMCLGRIITILCKKSPGNNENSTTQKKKALKNILLVLCPFTIAYLPIIAFIPFWSFLTAKKQVTTGLNCTIFQYLFSFPNFGIYICPIFFLSHLKKHLCFQIRRPTAGQTQGRMTDVLSFVSFEISRNITEHSHH